jgi:hypothetical protein
VPAMAMASNRTSAHTDSTSSANTANSSQEGGRSAGNASSRLGGPDMKSRISERHTREGENKKKDMTDRLR